MLTITREQIDTLVELQKLESECARVRKQLETMPHRLQKLDEEIAAQMSEREGTEAALKDLKREYRALEADLQMNQERVKQRKERLRSVKTNKEYQSTLKEIDDMAGKSSAIEDQMIERLDKIEVGEEQIREKEKEYQRISKDIEEEKTALQQEMEEARQTLSQLEQKRDDRAREANPVLLEKYNRILSRRNGVAIAPVVSAVCQGCHMNIPPQMFNELQRFDSLKCCPFCERIIYWKES